MVGIGAAGLLQGQAALCHGMKGGGGRRDREYLLDVVASCMGKSQGMFLSVPRGGLDWFRAGVWPW